MASLWARHGLSALLAANAVLLLSLLLKPQVLKLEWSRRKRLSLITPKMLHFSQGTLQARCRLLLQDAGLESGAAAIVADALVSAQRDGKVAHGLGRLPAILTSIRSGTVSGSARPSLTSVAPGILRSDAQGGLAMSAFAAGLPVLASTAQELGLCMLAVVGCRGIVGSLWAPLDRGRTTGLLPREAWRYIAYFKSKMVKAIAAPFAFRDLCARAHAFPPLCRSNWPRRTG
eukprot:6191255-Pleurochrysis_carterae.AAC.2